MLDIGLKTLVITFILLPGITWSLIWMKYSKTKPQTDKFYFLIYSLISSVFCYFLIYELSLCCPFFNFDQNDLLTIFNEDSTFLLSTTKLKIIFYATIISIGLGAMSILTSHKNFTESIFRVLKINYKYGDENLWEKSLHTYMLEKPRNAFIKVYDYKRDFIYDGHLRHMSDNKNNKEIFLENVIIYSNSTGQTINKMDKIYIIFDHQDFFIQFFK